MQCVVSYATGMYSYLSKLVLRYKSLILDACHPDTLYLREQGCEDSWLFFEAKRGREQNSLENTAVETIDFPAVDFIECLDDAFENCIKS